jgi:hypothetical protein
VFALHFNGPIIRCWFRRSAKIMPSKISWNHFHVYNPTLFDNDPELGMIVRLQLVDASGARLRIKPWGFITLGGKPKNY